MKVLRRATIMLFVILSLASCQSTQDSASLDESRALLVIIQSERSALIATENEAFSSLDDFPLPSLYRTYQSQLPQLEALLDNYLTVVAGSLRSALSSSVDYMFDYLDRMQITDVQSYLDRGYSSLTEDLDLSCREDIHSIFLTQLEEDSAAIDEAYIQMKREADIWRNNQANLAMVGQGITLDEITQFTDEQIATWATEAFFTSLAENEIVQRGRMMGEVQG